MLKKIPFQYRITVLYIFFGALWILFSDQMVVTLTNDTHKIHLLSTYKGWFFVLVTGILLYYLVRGEIRRRTLIFTELLEAKRKADESDRLKTTFLSNLSHYVRTPMNGILGFVQLLEDRELSLDKQKLFHSYINELSQHLLRTLNSIIEISKIQTGQLQLLPVKVIINEYVEKIASGLRFDLQNKNKPVEVLTTITIYSPRQFYAFDKDKVAEVFSNLLSNAVNFTDAGQIEIGCTQNRSELVFWVRDTGKGIPKEKADTLFDSPLLNTSTTCVIGEGAGLGLSLSAGLVNLMGGKIWLEPLEINGSKFCFSIPFSD
ncbi:MAG: hypothetical protein GXX78_12590 [Bacteroidales bacterium]|nr:hypothetical protein [Bacteroidales bacterium]